MFVCLLQNKSCNDDRQNHSVSSDVDEISCSPSIISGDLSTVFTRDVSMSRPSDSYVSGFSDWGDDIQQIVDQTLWQHQQVELTAAEFVTPVKGSQKMDTISPTNGLIKVMPTSPSLLDSDMTATVATATSVPPSGVRSVCRSLLSTPKRTANSRRDPAGEDEPAIVRQKLLSAPAGVQHDVDVSPLRKTFTDHLSFHNTSPAHQ